MHPFFQDIFNRLQDLHSSMSQALHGLPVRAVNWEPGEGMNSLAVLAAHTAGAERYWIGDMIARDSSARVRATEFEVQGASAPDLIALLDRTLSHSQGVLANMTLDDLTRTTVSPAHGREFSIGWALAHALEHTATHTGHMEITRQLWDQKHHQQPQST